VNSLFTLLDFLFLSSWIMSNEVDSTSAAFIVSSLAWEMDSDLGCKEWLNIDGSSLFLGISLKLTGWEKGSSFVVLPLLTVVVLNSDFSNDSLFEFSIDVEVTSSLKNNLFDCFRFWQLDDDPVIKVVFFDGLLRHGETKLRVQFQVTPLLGPEGFEVVLTFQLGDGLWFLHASHLWSSRDIDIFILGIFPVFFVGVINAEVVSIFR